VIEAQRASILVPHDHLHINQNSAVLLLVRGAGLRRVLELEEGGTRRRRPWRLVSRCASLRAMPVAAANGIEISYTDSGGEGLAVVFSHGYLMDHTMFDRQVTALAPQYRVITWDERGHGGAWATGPFTYWDSAADVLALLDHLGVERAVLAGMSQGGFLSLRAALTAPDRVRALVLIGSQAGLEDPAVAPGYEQMHQAWLEHGPGPVQEVVASIILGPGQWDGWYAKWNEQYAQWAPDDLGQLSWPFRCLMDRDDITGRLADITCPALIVHGTADAGIPVARAEAVRDGLGGPVTFVVVEGAAHASNVTHPDKVNRAVLGFLTGLDGE
jgi:3-oxoadipate enol-lactonase